MSNELNPGDTIEVPGFTGFWNVASVTPSGIVLLEKP